MVHSSRLAKKRNKGCRPMCQCDYCMGLVGIFRNK